MLQIHGFKRSRKITVSRTIIGDPAHNRRSCLILQKAILITDLAVCIQLRRVERKFRAAHSSFAVCTVFSVFQTVFFHLYARVIILYLVFLDFRAFRHRDCHRFMGNKARWHLDFFPEILSRRKMRDRMRLVCCCPDSGRSRLVNIRIDLCIF